MKKDEKTGYYINEVNGRKYAYVQKSHVWNKEEKRAETSLEYVGKIDDEGNFIPKKHLVKADITEDAEFSMLDEKRIGMARVLWNISSETKLTETLKEAFPKTWRAILAVAFYYVSSGVPEGMEECGIIWEALLQRHDIDLIVFKGERDGGVRLQQGP